MVDFSDIKQIWIFSTNFHERPQYQFDGNPSSGHCAETCGQPDIHTYRQGPTTKLQGTFASMSRHLKS